MARISMTNRYGSDVAVKILIARGSDENIDCTW